MMRQPTLSRLFSLVCLNDGRESRAVPSGQRWEDVNCQKLKFLFFPATATAAI